MTKTETFAKDETNTKCYIYLPPTWTEDIEVSNAKVMDLHAILSDSTDERQNVIAVSVSVLVYPPNQSR